MEGGQILWVPISSFKGCRQQDYFQSWWSVDYFGPDRRLSRSQYARHTLSGHLWPMNRQQCSSVIPHISRQMIHSLLQIKPSATLSIHCRCQRTEELTLPIYRVVHIFLELFWIFYQLTPAGQIIFVCVQTFERGEVFYFLWNVEWKPNNRAALRSFR